MKPAGHEYFCNKRPTRVKCQYIISSTHSCLLGANRYEINSISYVFVEPQKYIFIH